ncbi:MAG TPA: hypothetical protein PLP83_08070 [Candidatus Aminicenantes bacterium]|nr:hypothetical protein [Candidatus Aminicenantes bacterium]
MKAKRVAIVLAAVLAAATSVSCYRPYGYHLYPRTPRFAPTNPAEVRLLRGEPKRDHIRLGEVWIRPGRYADRYWVEGVLREKAAGLGADALVIVADRYLRGPVVYSYWYGPRRVVRRQIVGIAIRYRR